VGFLSFVLAFQKLIGYFTSYAAADPKSQQSFRLREAKATGALILQPMTTAALLTIGKRCHGSTLSIKECPIHEYEEKHLHDSVAA
jgi:hypothetical protein